MRKPTKTSTLFLLLLLFASWQLSAQNSSLNEQFMTWEDGAGWTSDNSPTATLSGARVIVRGSVKRTGTLTLRNNIIRGSRLTIDVGDTLVIDGNITIGSTSEIIVRDDAFLIILGNLNGDDNLLLTGSDVENDGTIIVTEDANFSENGNNQNDNDIYVFGETTGDLEGNPPLGEDDLPLNLEDFINDGAPLPIELKHLAAEKDENGIELNWITAKEENFSHFELERMVHDEEFKLVSVIQGTGNSLSDVAYHYKDSEAPYGLLYYRLKAVDIDGSFEYSEVLKIKNGYENKLAVFPNPTHSISQLKLVFPQDFTDEISSLMLYSTSGELLLSASNIDLYQQAAIFDEEVKSGLYLLKIQHNGIEENIRVIVK